MANDGGRRLAIALVVLAAACFVVFMLTFSFEANNKKAVLAVALGGTATTIAAWLWARTMVRT
jgi:hypothetical protein